MLAVGLLHYGVVDECKNIGSTARDLLANERTFLAWIRTGLGLIGVGVVMAKLSSAGAHLTQVAGLAFIVWGALVMVYAIRRYRDITELLEKGRYRVAMRGPIALVAVGLIASTLAALFVLL